MKNAFLENHIFTEYNLTISLFSIIKILNVWGVSENSGNLQQDGHKNFENEVQMSGQRPDFWPTSCGAGWPTAMSFSYLLLTSHNIPSPLPFLIHNIYICRKVC